MDECVRPAFFSWFMARWPELECERLAIRGRSTCEYPTPGSAAGGGLKLNEETAVNRLRYWRSHSDIM
jgi:hypothetical protein